MAVVDVSPTSFNTNVSQVWPSVTGRMLSIACTADGQELYCGSYSNIWASGDGGQEWEQLSWPQPDPSQYDVPGSMGGWGVVDLAATLGWRVEKHLRFLAKLTNSGFADIVGFGDCGVWTALGDGHGGFQSPHVVIPNFGYQAGGWQVDKHPRFVVDLNNDGFADIVGFGDAGVWTAIGKGDGTFQDPKLVLENFGVSQSWGIEHPRILAVTTNSGFADIVGFGDRGVYVAFGNGDGTFTLAGQPDPLPLVPDFGYIAGGWRVEKHIRVLADVNGDGFADIVAFGDAGVYVVLSNGDRTFNYHPDPLPVIPDFGYDAGWRVDKHPRFPSDLTGRGQASIVGFGNAGVYVALNKDDGSGGFNYQPDPLPVISDFGYDAGGWRVDKHPRFVADLTGHGQASIVGFGNAGVYVAVNKDDGSGSFNYQPVPVLSNFGYDAGGWRVDKHPRLLADLAGTGQNSVVGFGDAGVWTAPGDGQGSFPAASFALANFGYGTLLVALVANDLAVTNGIGSRGLWRSTDWGQNWTQIHQFSSAPNVGQLEWALGSDHLIYAAGGTSLAISKDAGATFQDVFPFGEFETASVNHVAVWQNAPADTFPAVIYVLGDSAMALSFDGGVNWLQDQSTLPPKIGGATNQVANGNTPKVMVISPRCVLEVYVAQNASTGKPNALYRGDYSRFVGAQQSSWESLILPEWILDLCHQDSGNVFLATTRKGCGDLLFYGPQSLSDTSGGVSAAWVGPLNPSAASDWQRLGSVHADLHGLLLSPDFTAELKNGSYQPGSGGVWMLSDGGVYRSSDGGRNFDPADNATTLATLSVAGVAIAGKGAALSLNQGDNDGFYSINGGQNWSYQQYGGGDNDCAFADPLRPHAMMIFTPRWDTSGNQPQHSWMGQTVSVYQTNPGDLPNASASGNDRKAVTGPPIDESRKIWNASSGFGNFGSRPIVLGLAGETAPEQGDYIFVLGPNDENPVLVRTQNIFNIQHRQEWITTATGPGQGANVFRQGPPLPEIGLGVVQAAGGHANTSFFVGGNGNLWTLDSGAANWRKIVPGPGAYSATRFFVHPYQPNLIYILDKDHVKRSNDGGSTWNADLNLEIQLTWNNAIPISSKDNESGLGDHFELVLTDMKFDPAYTQAIFAIGLGGAFMTIDGVNWTRLLHTAALPGRPSTCYCDSISESGATLYVAFAGRSLVKISGLSLSIIL